MASKMTSLTTSGRQNGRNEESEMCSLSQTEEMEVDCDSGLMSSVDPQHGDSVRMSPLAKDTVSHNVYWCACTNWNDVGKLLIYCA